MVDRQPGDRVGAMAFATQEGVTLFGYGVYQGEEIPPPGIIGPFGVELNEVGRPNPKILLDSGDVVWGCECWWGSEVSIRAAIGTRATIEIRPEDYRKSPPAVALEADHAG